MDVYKITLTTETCEVRRTVIGKRALIQKLSSREWNYSRDSKYEWHLHTKEEEGKEVTRFKTKQSLYNVPIRQNILSQFKSQPISNGCKVIGVSGNMYELSSRNIIISKLLAWIGLEHQYSPLPYLEPEREMNSRYNRFILNGYIDCVEKCIQIWVTRTMITISLKMP